MKGCGQVAAGLVLLAASAGLLGLGGGQGTAAGTEALVRRGVHEALGSAVEVTFLPERRAGSPETAPERVPVEVVEEDWSAPEPVPAETPAAAPAPDPAPAVPPGETPELRNETGYDPMLEDLTPLKEGLRFDGDPAVLIVHTHTTESYAETPGYRSTDQEAGVMAVGDVIAEGLEARGYRVFHDKTLCDYPEYEGAYDRSRQVMLEDLEACPDVALVLDVHRDAAEDARGEQIRFAVDTENGPAARIMLVVGTDAGGLSHPLWRQNLTLACLLQGRGEAVCPGLMRPINLRAQRFNQDLGELNLLVEVGSSGNSQEEALAAAELFSRALADLLDELSG